VAGGTVVEIKGDFPESIPKLTLQEMTQAYCESMPIYDKTNPNPASTVTLKDARNGQRYDIRRLQDGNCWMIDNLKLELTSGMELTPADTNVVNPTTVWFTDDSTASGAQLDNMTGNFTTSGGLTIDGSNALTGNNTDAWRQADPSNIDKCKNNVGTISGVPYAYDPTSETGCGYLYNHYTATAGTVDSNVVSSQVVDSICPAGWRLPSAGTGSSGTVYGSADLTVLNASMNANVRTTGVTTNSFQANWWPTGSFRGSLAGYYLNGFSQLGEMGSLWTATRASSGGRARYANFNANVINLAVESGDGRQMGSSVRCVTNNGSVAYNPITNNPLYDPEVTFDGVPATNVSVSDDRKTITATTPAHATAAYVDVVVDNGFTAATLRNGFVYYNPMKITSINPDHGLTGGNTTVTITGSGFLTPTTMSTPTTMQEMNQTYCASMPTYPATGGELTLPDTRDGQTYTIRKLADGKCWMTDNLRIADYAASSADTDLASGMTFNIPATTTTGTSDYDAVQVFGPVPDDTGAGATNYGYLYSWPAAVAGETRTSMPASSGNAPNSICPAGWRLPHGATGVWNDSDNDFSQLNIAMYGDPSLTTAGNYSNASHAANWQYGTAFNGVYAGIIDSWAGFGGQGGISEYWSATTDSNPDRAIGAEVYGASSISPVTEQLRYIGQAVRCVSDGGAGLELSVEFDGIDVLEIVSATDAEIVVRTPAHAAGLVDVKVDNDLTSDTVDDGYLYYNDLKITSIDPNHGLTDGGTTVTIYGTNFEPLTLPTIPVPTTMQQMSQAFCETLPIYDKTNPDPASTVELTDARDGTKYDVRRMQDGKCWMIDNLKLELEDGVELTPADTNVVNNTTVSLAAGGRSGNFTISGRLTLDNGYDTTSPNLDAWRQVDPSSTAYCLGDTADIIKDPSGSPSSLMKLNDVGSKTGCGYLYNFYTATAGSAAQADYDNGKGAGYIAQESICPSGWRLPSGHENAADLDNDFPFLNAKMYDPTATTGSTFGSTAYGANWWPNGSFRGVVSGQYNNASPTLQGEQGLFWSSNVYTGDAGSARVFKFASNGVGFGYTNRNYGLAVRCVINKDYNPAPTITFDGVPATDVSISSDRSTITATTPAHAAGLVDVKVENFFTSDTIEEGYLYYNELKITSIDPNHGLTDGDTTITITGANFEAIATPTPTTMQEMTQSYCASLPVYPVAGSTITLHDPRGDGQDYQIRRLQDGNCWMINNLKLGSTTGSILLTKADTNLTTNSWELPQISTASATYTAPAVYALRSGNAEYDASKPNSDETDNESPNFAGYYYNWCAATAGDPSTCTPSNIVASNAAQDICPANWRLPTGGNSGEYSVLNGSMYNGTLSAADISIDEAYYDHWVYGADFNGVMASYSVGSDSFQPLNTGITWASTANPSSSTYANNWLIQANRVYTYGNGGRLYGVNIRCVLNDVSYPIVSFDGAPAKVLSHSDTEIVVETPVHVAGLVDVTVSNGLSSDSLLPVYIDTGGDLADYNNVSSGYLYQDTYVDLTVDSSSVTVAVSPSTSGNYASSANTAFVKTNYLLGYNLSLSTNRLSSDSHPSDLKETTADRWLPATSNTCAWSSGALTSPSSGLTNNTWGFTLNPADLSAQKLCQVPAQDNRLAVKSTSAPHETDPADQTQFYYGTKVDFGQAAGTYSTTVVYTALGNI
jgi:uncharacterized protein (TIGR02145 family)